MCGCGDGLAAEKFWKMSGGQLTCWTILIDFENRDGDPTGRRAPVVHWQFGS